MPPRVERLGASRVTLTGFARKLDLPQISNGFCLSSSDQSKAFRQTPRFAEAIRGVFVFGCFGFIPEELDGLRNGLRQRGIGVPSACGGGHVLFVGAISAAHRRR